jgi:hypothetical protein
MFLHASVTGNAAANLRPPRVRRKRDGVEWRSPPAVSPTMQLDLSATHAGNARKLRCCRRTRQQREDVKFWRRVPACAKRESPTPVQRVSGPARILLDWHAPRLEAAMKHRIISVAAALVGAQVAGVACGSDATSADSSAFDSGVAGQRRYCWRGRPSAGRACRQWGE